MKKRKELNALLGNNRRPKAPNHHEAAELLPSSSSDVDVYIAPVSSKYNMAAKRVTRSNIGGFCNFRRFIRICLPICFLSLVAACITACIGIVWMQVHLQTDLEQIKDRLSKLNGWQDTQQPSVKNLQKSVAEIEQNLNDLQTKENGVTDLAHKLNALVAKVDEQITIPMQAIEKVKDDIATVTQRIATLEENVKSLLSANIELKQTQNELSEKITKNQEEISSLNAKMEAKNSESDLQQLVPKISADLKSEITLLNGNLTLLSDRVKSCEAGVDVLTSHDKLSQEQHVQLNNSILLNQRNIKEANMTLYSTKEKFGENIAELYSKITTTSEEKVKNNSDKGAKEQPDTNSVTIKPQDGNKEQAGVDPMIHQAKYSPVPSHYTDTIIGDTTASVTVQPNEKS